MKTRSIPEKALPLTLLSLWLLSTIACGSGKRDIENYGDVTRSAGGIPLIDPNEHLGGWGRKDCLLCHNAALNVHRGPGSVIDVDALNQAIRTKGESAYCLSCHGPNGVSQ